MTNDGWGKAKGWSIKGYYITGVGDGINYGVYEGNLFDKEKKLISTHSTFKAACDQIEMYKETDKQSIKMINDERNIK